MTAPYSYRLTHPAYGEVTGELPSASLRGALVRANRILKNAGYGWRLTVMLAGLPTRTRSSRDARWEVVQ